ncbi:Ger(x)C family spore germination protein [Virgibacillus halodenitrificans]|uniref:Ger(x)C family spore germination protein n=1 Tax=Virgibacillus halodenitrificans TaxID=1482 RepID=UPI0002D33073|nr:Ger(x)C family spore germination protein [Virgibacillus halodenitrificans]
MQKLIIVCICLLLLMGCSDIKEIQKMNYATAIGIEYKEGRYVTHVQMVGLNSLSNVEGAQGATSQILVSESSGETFNDALFDLYNTAQERIIWSHVSSIILDESAIKEGFDDILDGILRYHEFRPTPWIFGVKGNMTEIMSTPGFFNQPPTETILHNPENIEEQDSIIRPIKLHQYAREITEPAFTTFLPSLYVNKKQWEQNQEDDPKLSFDGAFFIGQQGVNKYYELDEIRSIRWATPDTKRTSVTIPYQDSKLLVVIENVRINKQYHRKKGKPQVDYNVKFDSYVTNQKNRASLNNNEISKKISSLIKKEIIDFYELGKEDGVDFLNLEYELYREDYKLWKQLKNEGLYLKTIKLNPKVDVYLRHSGAGKIN